MSERDIVLKFVSTEKKQAQISARKWNKKQTDSADTKENYD